MCTFHTFSHIIHTNHIHTFAVWEKTYWIKKKKNHKFEILTKRTHIHTHKKSLQRPSFADSQIYTAGHSDKEAQRASVTAAY